MGVRGDRRLIALLAGLFLLTACGGSGAATQSPGPGAASTAGGTASASATLSLPTPHPTDQAIDVADFYLGGTITWNATGSDDSQPVLTESSSGTANVVIHVINPYLLLAEREDHSTYSYNYSSNSDLCPSSHEEGTLESQAGVGSTDPTDYSIGTLNPSGPTSEDLSLLIAMPDYCGPSMGSTVDRSRGYIQGFPDCEPGGDQLFARFDGVDSYVIDCDVIGYGPANEFVGTASGHVSGTLSPVDAPQN